MITIPRILWAGGVCDDAQPARLAAAMIGGKAGRDEVVRDLRQRIEMSADERGGGIQPTSLLLR